MKESRPFPCQTSNAIDQQFLACILTKVSSTDSPPCVYTSGGVQIILFVFWFSYLAILLGNLSFMLVYMCELI